MIRGAARGWGSTLWERLRDSHKALVRGRTTVITGFGSRRRSLELTTLRTRLRGLYAWPQCLKLQGEEPTMVEEAFFTARPGQQQVPHLDPGCHFTLSTQLRGTKLWRLTPVSKQHGGGAGLTFLAKVRRGDAVLFGPGWRHATTALPP